MSVFGRPFGRSRPRVGDIADILESITDAFIAIDSEFRILYINRQAERLLLNPRDKLLGASLVDVFPEFADSVFHHNFQRALHDQTKVEFEECFAPLNVWVECHAYPSRTGLSIYFRDVSDRRRANDALRQSEETYRSLFETMTQGVVYLNDAGKVLSANPAAQRILGLHGGELVGEMADSLEFHTIHEDGRAFAEHEFPSRVALNTGNSVRGVVMGVYNKEEQQYRWIKVDAVPQFRLESPAQVYVIFDDITDRKRAEEVMRASEKLAATGRLAASIAHEINNPLESVTNLLYLLEHDSRLHDDARRYASLAQQELGRVAHIARQTLGFYRDTTTPVPVKITALLDNVLELYERKLLAGNISVERDFEAEPEIEGFPGELRQVFSNLIVNAIESVGHGGRLRLHVYTTRDWNRNNNARARLERRPRNERRGVHVVIADTGPGISQSYQQKLFEPFFTTKGERGTGLGLWVSQGIVQKHGGRIRFRSSTRPGSTGTVFSVFLPLRTAWSKPVRAAA